MLSALASGPLDASVPRNASDLHALLAKAKSSDIYEFKTHEIETEFKDREYTHLLQTRCLWDVLKDLVSDPDLHELFVFDPEQHFVQNPETEEPMLVLEEPWHGKAFWNFQTQVGPGGRILYIQLYADATKITVIGSLKVWPVYAWLGNLPAHLRKRDGKGGATLIAYLPVVEKDQHLSKADLASLRVHIYHEAFKIILESIKAPAQFGELIECGDGIVRKLFPTISVISADYEELAKILSILGHQSGFPCPVCLVPRGKQGDLSGTVWPRRTHEETLLILERAENASTKQEAKEIRQEQSLRATQSSFIDVMGSMSSIYEAACTADPLHQIEQGIFGHHLWPKLKSLLNRTQKAVLDDRFKAIPPYPDLKHFPNGITELEYMEGHEHATVLRLLAPLIEDLLPPECQQVICSVLRSLAAIHLLAKMTTHTDNTLERLTVQIRKFGELWQVRFVFQLLDFVVANFPKLHSMSHLVECIRYKSTTDNYHTGLGEAQHPQSKEDFKRTNHRPGFEDQVSSDTILKT
ncbi:hypothetical protein RSOL_437800 [Rhizoctonia solani AG-3 Rhs1AP]|uniref:Uncharacterized protein n=2 Tax=Rhizoctonia solani AG-3 TaxID=1086053 RepID=A0A074RWZ2_9AGAM|nr:hypothetical protein RSOL_437800 [Rhizoctonia solani AG-3 Rhs1AP]KEP51459.1 hypothetical protein V565_061510 [Rhizoctonia solani 123E]